MAEIPYVSLSHFMSRLVDLETDSRAYLAIIAGMGVSGAQATTSTQTNVAGSATSVLLLAANPNRLSASFFNDAAANCRISLGSAASTTNFTYKSANEDVLVIRGPTYTGDIYGIWESAGGFMRVTELT